MGDARTESIEKNMYFSVRTCRPGRRRSCVSYWGRTVWQIQFGTLDSANDIYEMRCTLRGGAKFFTERFPNFIEVKKPVSCGILM